MIIDLQLPPNSVAARSAGSGALDFAFIAGKTVARRITANSPLKLLNPKNRGTSAWVYASSYGGGLLGGDQLSMDVSVGAGASALLATQASTKIYRSDLPCGQRLEARVEDNALLAVTPDPLVCFADSDFSQRQTFHLAGSANLAVLDWLNAGRRASGERWAFRRYHSRIDIHREGKRVLHESLLLDPEHGVLAPRLSRFNSLALLVLTGPALNEAARAALDSIAAQPLSRNAETIVSASPLADGGALLRVAGIATESVGIVLRQHLKLLCPLLGDDPWARKW
jgi:urease accessory protein